MSEKEPMRVSLNLFGFDINLDKQEQRAITNMLKERILLMLKEGEFDEIIQHRILYYEEHYKKLLRPIVREILDELELSVRFDANE